MQCKNCGNEIPENRKFCSKSCSTIFNNKTRKISTETKNKISAKLKKQFPVEEIINLYNEGKSALEISKQYGSTAKTIIALLKEHNVWKVVSNKDRICEKHNIPYEQYSNGGKYVCKKCCTEDISERRRELKRKSVDYKGGKCQYCGYNKSISALEFHHLDPSEKDFHIGNGNLKKWETVKLELDKCILLCANCHREVHDKLNDENQ
jgi:5-methylcytosine-specific restriction endonuclease McrA